MCYFIGSLMSEMNKYPPYSINSVITGVCVCFSSALGVDLGMPEKVTTEVMLFGTEQVISQESYPHLLFLSFQTLCKFISDDKLLKAVYKIVRELNLDKCQLKDAIESLITEELPNLAGAENVTPAQIIRLCVNILNPLSGSICDANAGTGSTVFEAHKYATESGGKLTICAQEVDILSHALSIIRAFLNGININQLHCGNTLTDPKTVSSNNKLQKYDYAIMIPPLKMSWKDIEVQIRSDSFNRFTLGLPPTSNADWLFLQHQLASLQKGGKAIIAMTAGSMFNASTMEVRKAAVRLGIIECIITLPSGMMPKTNIPISLVVVGEAKGADSAVLMIQTEDLFKNAPASRSRDVSALNDEIIARICELFRRKEQVQGTSILVGTETLMRNNCILLPSRYVSSGIVETELGEFVINYPKSKDWATLADTGTLYRGINVSPNAEANKDGHYKIINLADVQDGEIHIESLEHFSLIKDVQIENYKAKPGDVLISCKGFAIKVCVVPEHDEQILLSINFIGIHVDRSIFCPLFLKYYLESPAAQAFLHKKQVGTSIITLNKRDVMTIPIPDLSLQEQLDFTHRLSQNESEIRRKTNWLYEQSIQAKFEFYRRIGLGEIMNRVEGDMIKLGDIIW